MNTLDTGLATDLRNTLETITAKDTVRVCVIRGAGRAFMAGGDIKYFADALAAGDATGDDVATNISPLFDDVHEIIRLIRRMPVPVLAAVHGSAAGYGLSLMASCDMAVTAQSTKFTLAYRHLGVSPDGGSTWFLPRIIGIRKAMELALLGDRFDADQALDYGLVNSVLPDDGFDEGVTKLAMRLASGPRDAIARTKALIYGSMESAMSAQLDAEQESFLACAGGKEFREGVSAFIDKRAPDFKGLE